MRTAILISAALLSACGQSATEKAEAEYKIVSENKSSTYGDMCKAASKTADLYLEAQDKKKYEEWDLYRRIYCSGDPAERPFG